ncbi:hypothetical protein EZV62_010961 [Acer yangbiense]|uniref:Reverse transcriptase Ty1/copia-type domain-containing protein n=1 Tax=Acer yangbiense TaxID=1000413 RepID=A0A5C7I3W7_9ROSI|nr:hypothetical protein EZV62_010961 [Acer yangbiense]
MGYGRRSSSGGARASGSWAHGKGINEERVEQQQPQVRAQVELSPLQEQGFLVSQQPKQQFQRSIALYKPKQERKKLERILGAAQKILGMQIRRDRVTGKIWLSQAKYIQNILERFNMNEAKPVTTPLAAHYRLRALQCPTIEKELEEMSKVPYASVVGCLMYVMASCREIGKQEHMMAEQMR